MRFDQPNSGSEFIATFLDLVRKMKVRHLIETYESMGDGDKVDTGKWSYYDEYLKSNQIKKGRQSIPRSTP